MDNETNEAKNVPTASSKKSHVVVKGDTLVAISKKYNVKVEKIRSLNEAALKNLKIGDKLALE